MSQVVTEVVMCATRLRSMVSRCCMTVVRWIGELWGKVDYVLHFLGSLLYVLPEQLCTKTSFFMCGLRGLNQCNLGCV